MMSYKKNQQKIHKDKRNEHKYGSLKCEPSGALN